MISYRGDSCSSVLSLPDVYRMSAFRWRPYEQVLEITKEMVTCARSHVDDVEFSAEDALRSDYDFLSEVRSRLVGWLVGLVLIVGC